MKMKTTITTSMLRKMLTIAILGITTVLPAFSQYFTPNEQTYSVLEPEDIVFNIEWNGYTEITSLIYTYYDEFDEYQETIMNSPTNYAVDGNTLTINQSFIQSIYPESSGYMQFYAEFDGSNNGYFNINIVYTLIPYVLEDSKDYDLSNPTDVFGTIAWCETEEITSVKIDETIVPTSNYYINGDWLFFNDSYLSTALTASGNSIEYTMYFDSGDTDAFTIEAIQTGVNNATLSQYEFDINESTMPEYIESIITWNSSTSIESMSVTYFDDGAPVIVDPFESYTVTAINAQTATLRIAMGGAKSNNAKMTDYYYASVEIIFNTGSPSYIFLGIFSEYYFVEINDMPWTGGYHEGAGNYDVDEEVSLQAYPNAGYTFVKWVINGTTEVTENPYTFDMPANDLNINAIFLSDYPEVLSTFPLNWDNNVDPNATIYITFDRDIAEGTANNGFDDITMYENGIDPWMISDIHIENGNMLIIVPAAMNMNTGYHIDIPADAIEDIANPELIMNNPFNLSFNTGFGDYNHGEINPEYAGYSILEPGDVNFDIDWGEDTYISDVAYYYFDEFDDYYQIILTNSTDYVINDNVLTINSSFISSLSPDAGTELYFYTVFESGWHENFVIMVVQTSLPSLAPDAITYDLSNPADIHTNIVLNSASSVSSVSFGALDLVEDTDYVIDGTWLFIKDSYLSGHLLFVDNEIILTMTFDTDDEADLTITAVESGLTIPTIDPQYEEYSNANFPETLEITITWNDATYVSTLFVWAYEEGEMQTFEYPYFVVTPIDAETALLSIDMTEAGKGKNGLKTTEMFNASIEIVFDIYLSVFYYLTIIEEYYDVTSISSPEYGGEVSGEDTYSVGEEVQLNAYANTGYQFQSWKINGIVVSTENTYIFEMPTHDVLVTASFTPIGTVLYTLDISLLPLDSGTTSGAGDYEEGEEVTILATPNTGYAFTNWTDGESAEFATSAEYTFTMPANDLSLTANFFDNTGVEENVFASQSVYPNPFSDYIIISNPETVENVIFTNITGQIVAEHNNLENGQINTFDLAKGFYIMIMESENGERLVKKVLKQ
jgi:hypothetical protein